MPESRGAWAHGGRPQSGDDATRELFERGLPGFVTALDRFRAARSLTAVLDQSRQVVESGGAADSHVRSVDALNAAIASRGLAYYVDAEVLAETRTGQHRVHLSTFTVERVRYYRAADTRVRALRSSGSIVDRQAGTRRR